MIAGGKLTLKVATPAGVYENMPRDPGSPCNPGCGQAQPGQESDYADLRIWIGGRTDG